MEQKKEITTPRIEKISLLYVFGLRLLAMPRADRVEIVWRNGKKEVAPSLYDDCRYTGAIMMERWNAGLPSTAAQALPLYAGLTALKMVMDSAEIRELVCVSGGKTVRVSARAITALWYKIATLPGMDANLTDPDRIAVSGISGELQDRKKRGLGLPAVITEDPAEAVLV